MSLRLTASAEFARALASAMDALGWSSEAALKALDLGDGTTARDRVPVDRLNGMFAAAEAATGDPAIGIRSGHRFRVAAHGRTGAVYAYARDLPDVIDLNARYQKLSVDLGAIRYRRTDGRHLMEFAPHDTDPARLHHASGMLMGAYVTAYRWLNWGAGEELVSVGLPGPACARLRETARTLFRCPVVFDTDTGHLEFTPRAMQTPLATSDEEKRARAVALMENLLEDGERADAFCKALEAAVRAGLAAGPFGLGTLADRMDLSESKLRARMRETGRSYRTLVDDVRRDIMRERHAAGDSLSQIAGALGYNDQAAFNRAVRRWYGVAPGQWSPDTPLRQAPASEEEE